MEYGSLCKNRHKKLKIPESHHCACGLRNYMFDSVLSCIAEQEQAEIRRRDGKHNAVGSVEHTAVSRNKL